MEKILIIRLSSIGDIIQALAIPRHIHAKFPKSSIHWVVRSDNLELLQNNPYVTQTYSFDRKDGIGGWLKLCQKLRQENFTHVYDAHNKIRSQILRLYLKLSTTKFFLVRPKERFKRFLLFWLKIKKFQKTWNGIDTYILPLEKWGIKNDKLGSELFLNVARIQKAKIAIESSGARLASKLIAIAPATAWPKKTWPKNHWINLITMILKADKEKSILILGGPKDAFCAELATINPSRVFSLQGKLSLMESAAAISFCETLIAADTGLLHMAEAIGKDVIGICGPTHLGYTYRKNSKTLTTQLWCQPCTKDGSGICINKKYQKCMTEILPTQVFEALSTDSSKID